MNHHSLVAPLLTLREWHHGIIRLPLYVESKMQDLRVSAAVQREPWPLVEEGITSLWLLHGQFPVRIGTELFLWMRRTLDELLDP